MHKRTALIVICAILALLALGFISFLGDASREEISRIKPLLTTVDLLTRMLGTPMPFVGQ